MNTTTPPAAEQPISPVRIAQTEKFIDVYLPLLRRAQTDYPKEYGTHPPPAEIVTERMHAAILNGTYSKDGRAMKATCKALGIPHNYRAIEAYLRGE
jgi:hypothetical protein